MNSRTLLSCSAALVLAITGGARSADPASPSPTRHHQDGPQPRRDHPHSNRPGDIQGRIGHMTEAVRHLRAAGLNDPADNIEKMAREMREHLERERRQQGGETRSAESQVGRSLNPPAGTRGIEDLQKEVRSLSRQVQELRSIVQNRNADHRQPSPSPDRGDDRKQERGRSDGDRHPGAGETGRDGGPREETKREDRAPAKDQHSEPARDGASRPSSGTPDAGNPFVRPPI